MDWILCIRSVFAAGRGPDMNLPFHSCCAVPTGCSEGLLPCVWRGAEGRQAPGRGGCNGAVLLLLQERAVQTAWRSGRHKPRSDATGNRTWTWKRQSVTDRCDETKKATDRKEKEPGGLSGRVPTRQEGKNKS